MLYVAKIRRIRKTKVGDVFFLISWYERSEQTKEVKLSDPLLAQGWGDKVEKGRYYELDVKSNYQEQEFGDHKRRYNNDLVWQISETVENEDFH